MSDKTTTPDDDQTIPPLTNDDLFSGSNLPDDDDEWDYEEPEPDPRIAEAVRNIVNGFGNLCALIGREQAWQDTSKYLESVRPKKPKGPKPRVPFYNISPADKAILAAYDRAPARGVRKDLTEVYAVPPAAGTQAREARKKLLGRLLKLRREERRILDQFREFSAAQNGL